MKLRITINNGFEFPNLNPVQISENATLGSVVAQIQVLGGSSEVTYSLGEGNTGNVFAIDPITGTIVVNEALNFEQINLYNLTVIATSSQSGSSGSLMESGIQVVEVLDINEAPTFTNSCAISSNSVCNIMIAENEPIGTLIDVFTGDDPDLSSLPNGQITFSINALALMHVSLTQLDRAASILSNEIFDREMISDFSFVIMLTDSGSPSLSVSATVNVAVEDINDNPPVFVQAPTDIQVLESAPVNIVIAQYEATDRDIGMNAEIIYSLASKNSTMVPFEIDMITGVLIVAAPLDFETIRSYDLLITASNPSGLSAEVCTSIDIVDVNEGMPIFNQSVYSGSVIENDQVGTFVLCVDAMDNDCDKDDLNFTIREGNFNNSFTLDEDGCIFISSEVDREVIDFFNLTISVTDCGIPALSSFASVLINIVDVNDNAPQFMQDRFEVDVREDADSTVIFTAFASDRDESLSNNSMITFDLNQTSNVGGVFNLTQIDNNRFSISVVLPLDFGTRNQYNLLVTATDRGSPPLSNGVIVQVNIIDVIELPNILTGNGTVNVSEGVIPGSSIAQVNISILEGVELNYTILSISGSGASGNSGNSGNPIFVIDSDGVIRVAESLDFEATESYTIIIEVSDSVQMAVVTVIVNVIDENEEPPVFVGVGNFSVLEEELEGAVVGVVVAVDGDTGPGTDIIYSIVPDSIVATFFSINPQLGNITTSVVLDREELVEQNLFSPSSGSRETITVVATDTETPFRSSISQVDIMLVDINDNSPIIENFQTPVSVLENQIEGLVVRTGATDRDIGNNGNFFFSLELISPVLPPGLDIPFSINGIGEITNTAVLDSENISTYVLSLEATDEGEPPNDSDTVIFVVNVEDVNDNTPVFSNSSYEVCVFENETLQSELLLVSATDADISPSNSEISFAIISSDPSTSASIFTISNTGMISLVLPLDFESIQTHTLVIEAIDSGSPALFARVNVTILVKNVDEVPPVFFGTCTVSIIENRANPGSPVTQCMAFDVDEITGQPRFDVPLTYEITSGNINDTFSILMDGSLILEQQVDREEIDFYLLGIQVTDQSGLIASTFLNVTILDDNDNIPIVSNEVLLQAINRADIMLGEINFFTVMATDDDIGINAELSYVVNEFTVSVDGLRTEIAVMVSDTGVPSLSTSVLITLIFDTPCFLQDHMINAFNGSLISSLFCDVNIVPENLDVIFGGSLELECFILSNIQPTTVEFLHNNSVVLSMGSDLVINNVTFEDGGDYECRVSSDFGVLMSNNGIVTVLGKYIHIYSITASAAKAITNKCSCLNKFFL